MRFLPWLCFAFFARRLRIAVTFASAWMREPHRYRAIFVAWYLLKALFCFVAVAFMCPAAFVLELALVALLIVDFLPIEAVQNVVKRINLAISAILGDCFIFASSDFRQQAVASKLSRDLSWLEENCNRIVIVAHSQGAAVTYLALRQYGRRKVNLFISFGAGILKLFQLSRPEHRDTILLVAFVAFFLALTEIYVFAAVTGLSRTPIPIWSAMLMIPLMIIGILLGISLTSEEGAQEIEARTSEFKEQGLHWVDFYAALDPVPNGPLLLPTPEDLNSSRGPESIQLCNQLSILADHTSYMTNRDEFLPMVVEAIGRYSGTNVRLPKRDYFDICWASAFRRIRITIEKTDQTILLVALFAYLFERRTFEALGTWLVGLTQVACGYAEGTAGCWQHSATITGLAALIAIYLILRMTVQALHWAGASLSRSVTQLFIFLFAAISHSVTCVTLSFAVLLYHAPFSWVVWLYKFVGERELSVEAFQGIYLGLAVGLIVTAFDGTRAYFERVNN
ncbi:hypothetical protein B5V03_02275 [Bradyrhizobium betae]|uniref:Uncharacterized protein n=2 Tax=Bradyrhizobium betae TaxID=244734 RepID=A0A4Q1VS34_9BRAD|nr:hypothetical protein B5V03_02275 [Bradyrhizobium betae]